MSIDRRDTARVLMETFKKLAHVMRKSFFRSISNAQKPSSIFVMLRLLRANRAGLPGLRVNEIATDMGITVPAVTQLVTGLEKSGHVRRDMDPEDRRAVRVSITDTGARMFEPAFRQLEDLFSELIEYLGDEDATHLVRLLLKTEEYFCEKSGINEGHVCTHG